MSKHCKADPGKWAHFFELGMKLQRTSVVRGTATNASGTGSSVKTPVAPTNPGVAGRGSLK